MKYCIDKCNKVDFRSYYYGVTMANPRSLKAELGKVTKIDSFVIRIKVEVVAWAGKRSTQ